MDEIKNKFMNLLNKQGQQVKIPPMGFSDYFIRIVTTGSSDECDTSGQMVDKKSTIDDTVEKDRLCDQEILDGTQPIYFTEGTDIGRYVLDEFGDEKMTKAVIELKLDVLKQQHTVISTNVLQNILEQKANCNKELEEINETAKILQESLWVCKNARELLGYSRTNLTTTSLEILATYKKRETYVGLLKTLQTIEKLKSTDAHLQKLLTAGDYSAAITVLLECKTFAADNSQYKCVEALSRKLQDTLIMVELQLDGVLEDVCQCFDSRKYGKLQEAYRLLGKTIIATDQMHMNFISAIHSTAFTVLRNYIEMGTDDKQKMLYEQMCENVPTEKYIVCLINLCRSFWTILVCYYQCKMWHQTDNTQNTVSAPDDTEHTKYMLEKFQSGQFRIWNDVQSKIHIYLSSPKLHSLRFEQFVQVLSIVQRLKKVGYEFCGDSCSYLMDSIRTQSVAFFKRYHVTCLEEICLFLDNEAWVPVSSFTNVLQLQEFRFMKSYIKHHNSTVSEPNGNTKRNNFDDTLSSIHSQDGSSSIYGSYGYFHRFAEKSSPFDGGFDEQMLQEDILAGIADESSCYFSENSEEELETGIKHRTVDIPTKPTTDRDLVLINNSSLNVLRCIGRYLHLCRLLNTNTPEIVQGIGELIDFYTFGIHEIFGKDLPIPSDNLYSTTFISRLNRIRIEVLSKVRNWPPSSSMIQIELCNSETLYGFQQRIVGVECCIALVKQLYELSGHLEPILGGSGMELFQKCFTDTNNYIEDIRKPIYMCVTARVIDLPLLLTNMGKVKWDINHVNVQHSYYVEIVNRGIQMFAMRLEEISTVITIPKVSIWDCLAHIITHTLVEGYSNTKKCTAAGRALMQLDYAHFISILELISGLKHSIHHSYVDAYIKAYYMPKELLHEWIVEQKSLNVYSTKQLSALIMCTCSTDKKTRLKLLELIESGSNSGQESSPLSP